MKYPNCTCDVAKKYAKMAEEDQVHQFLMGLGNDAYSNVRSQILALDPLPPLDKIYSMVQQEENHKKVMQGREHRHKNASAFAVSHLTKGGQYSGEQMSCKHCGKLGHKEANYFELIGYSAGWSTRGDVAAGVEDGMVKEVGEPTQAEGNGVVPRRNKSMQPMPKTAAALLRPGKIDPTRVTRTERTEILPKLTPEIIDLKFTRTENDLYRTELNPNIFFLNHFSF